jgi:hypothetical protein
MTISGGCSEIWSKPCILDPNFPENHKENIEKKIHIILVKQSSKLGFPMSFNEVYIHEKYLTVYFEILKVY